MKKMLTKLKMSLTNNIGLKFLAVLIALVLWLAIVNVNDPEKTITVSNIPISVTNESAITSRDMVYNVKSEQYLNITVSGKRSIVSNLSAEDFRATASLKELSKVNSIPVDVTTKNASLGRKITIVKQSAQTILVDVENVEEKDFTDLVVEYTGKVADGYVAGLSSMSTDEVTVKAPTSIIDKIKKVAVRCSLDGTNTNISKKCPVILYDKNDKEIKSDEIELSDKKIRVNVNVLRAKQVPISTISKDELGKPADGYVVDDVILSSDSITVYGSEESLDSIESLDIQDDIDVSDAKGDVTQNIDVTGKLPKGLSVSGESTITVKVLIKKLITRTFEYDASEVSLNDLSSDLDVQLVTKKVKVTLQGEEEVISQLTKDDMAISADLGKVKEGTTTVHVDVAVPDNTTLMNNVTIKIKAKAK
ncbi:YbbR-like domain-containing protein [Eubacterium ventriosum]|uniref:CdaR family protein n=1 Tax=Eubacterium ventriosum TaxID=39496 RepID=UPI00399A04E7